MDYKVSVVVPAYNVEQFIKETLDSLLCQTLQGVEIIVVNDCSTDNTQIIIDQYINIHSSITSVKFSENRGVAAARNTGIELAKGDYLAFVDGDDMMPAYALKDLYTAAKKYNADLVMGITKTMPVYEDSNCYPKIKRTGRVSSLNKNLIWSFSMSNKLFRRKKVIEENRRVPALKCAEDGVFSLSFAFNSRVVMIDRVVLLYRKHLITERKSATQITNNEMLEDYLYAHKYLIDLAKEKFGERANSFIELMRFRAVNLEINQYYRKFWRVPESILEKIKKRVNEYINILTPMYKGLLFELHSDINLNNLVTKHSFVADNPAITVIINVTKPNLIRKTLLSIYNQSLYSYEVFISKEGSAEIIYDTFDIYSNFHILDISNGEEFLNTSLEKAKGKYVMFIEEGDILLEHMFKLVYESINIKHDFAVTSMSNITSEGKRLLKTNYLAIKDCKNINICSSLPYYPLDMTLSNKIFSFEYLKRLDFKFSDNYISDILRLWQNARFIGISLNKSLVLTKNEEDYYYQRYEMISEKLDENTRLKCNEWLIAAENVVNQIKSKTNKLNITNRFNKFSPLFLFKMCVASKICSKFIPVIKNKILFYSQRDNRLSDNLKQVYDGINIRKKVVLTSRMPQSIVFKIRAYYHTLTSKVIIIDDYDSYLKNVCIKKEQCVIQLWHACGAFKRFGLDGSTLSRKNEVRTHYQYTHVIVSAEGVREIYARAFGVEPEIVKALGSPRTDVLFNGLEKAKRIKKLIDTYPELNNRKIILYAPTFREYKGKKSEFYPEIEWMKLSESLDENQLFVILPHPVMTNKLICNGEKFINIIELPNADTLALMLVSQMLITDYSSVIFEYALLNKPIILYIFDKDIYDRGFYIDFPNYLPANVALNTDELINAIQNPVAQDYKDFISQQMKMCDGDATERVVKLIEECMRINSK